MMRVKYWVEYFFWEAAFNHGGNWYYDRVHVDVYLKYLSKPFEADA